MPRRVAVQSDGCCPIVRAFEQSGGCAVAVDEGQIVDWMQMAASSEGISVCPESAACVGAALSLAASGWIGRDDRAVLFNCGAAKKYPHVAVAQPPQIENASNLD